MFGKSNKPNLNAINSIVAAGMEVEGCITFKGTMKISGDVKGDVFRASGVHDKSSTVIVEGSVTGGTIEADHVVVTGTVAVNKIIAHQSLIIISGGKANAEEIFYGSITSDETAVINGKLTKISDQLAAEKAGE